MRHDCPGALTKKVSATPNTAWWAFFAHYFTSSYYEISREKFTSHFSQIIGSHWNLVSIHFEVFSSLVMIYYWRRKSTLLLSASPLTILEVYILKHVTQTVTQNNVTRVFSDLLEMNPGRKLTNGRERPRFVAVKPCSWLNQESFQTCRWVWTEGTSMSCYFRSLSWLVLFVCLFVLFFFWRGGKCCPRLPPDLLSHHPKPADAIFLSFNLPLSSSSQYYFEKLRFLDDKWLTDVFCVGISRVELRTREEVLFLASL